MNYYLLSASGQDHPGFVAQITKILFDLNCNLEDSSMMRLGSEFAMFLIFTSRKNLAEKKFIFKKNSFGMKLGIRKITKQQAQFQPAKKDSYIIRVHGKDQPGLVFHITDFLAKKKFNITDLRSHRSGLGQSHGYILFIEGETLEKNWLPSIKLGLKKLGTKLRVKIGFEPLNNLTL
ncbi:MAG: hypothetical protein KCHDKBKB_01881 [Elusimicrobia bacterium]|nr:hypothetical protein [Elusimicrobiota bacterium]